MFDKSNKFVESGNNINNNKHVNYASDCSCKGHLAYYVNLCFVVVFPIIVVSFLCNHFNGILYNSD